MNSRTAPETRRARLRRAAAVAVAALMTWPLAAAEHLLFTSFRNNGEDGLHLALSEDGYRWTALQSDRSFLKPAIGEHKLMRDPCLAQGPDGVFHLVWTCGWTAGQAKLLGHAHSRDLLTWSGQQGVQVMENEPQTRNIWAPELFYDAAKTRWLIFWSSTIPGRFPATDATGDDGYNHRAYVTTTKDFIQFTPSRLFFDPGYNIIDATLLAAEGKFHLIFKDERKNPVKKNLRRAVADSPEGPFGQVTEPFTGDWVEGPSAIKIKGQYLVYFDHYTNPHYYGAVRSKDLVHWEDCSKEMTFPPGHRHGTVLRISAEIAARLK